VSAPRLLVVLAVAACGGGRDATPAARGADGARSDVPPGATRVVALAGDTMLARMVSEAIAERGAESPFDPEVAALVRGADLAFVNLECVIAEGGAPFQPPRVFYFRATPQAVATLTSAGIDGVNLANNHALDYGPDALLECVRRLDEAHVAHVGAGRDAGAAAAPVVLSAGDLRIGFVGFADHFEEYRATPDRPGTNYMPTRNDDATVARVRSATDAARAAGAQLVVFSWHHGPNMRTAPDDETIALARRLVDEAGVDVVHGHSAHCFQGVEVRGGRVILYDTGDFVDDYAVDPAARNDEALLCLLAVDARGVRRLDLVPLHIEDMRVRRVRGADAAPIRADLERRSRAFGTKYDPTDDDRLRVTVR
jgi:poly-gamma-glutamate capsule biosynthesis protein CapA/YwtB (metallophosphatase superfamily)